MPGASITAPGSAREAVTDVEREWEASLGTADWHELKRLLVRLNDSVKGSAPTGSGEVASSRRGRRGPERLMQPVQELAQGAEVTPPE
jgi:hypothetical protein